MSATGKAQHSPSQGIDAVAASSRRVKAPLLVALVLLLMYTLPLGTVPRMWNPNEMSRIMLAVALAQHGKVQLDEVALDYDGDLPQDHSIRHGHAYSDKAPGLSFVAAAVTYALDVMLPRYKQSAAPDYWTLRHILTWLLVCIPAALWTVWAATTRGRQIAIADDDRHQRSVRGPTRSRSAASSPTGAHQPTRAKGHDDDETDDAIEVRNRALALAVVFALATPMLTYATLFFAHVPAGLLAATAFILVAGPMRPGSTLSGRRAFVAGVLASFAVVTEYPAALLALVTTIAIAIDRQKRPAIGWFIAGAVLAALPLLAYNQAAWGSPFTTGYHFKGAAEHAAIHRRGFFGVAWPTLDGLWGVLLGGHRGLLIYCPLLICVFVGWIHLWQSDRAGVCLSFSAAIAYVMFAAGFVDWEGGWSAAARHLVPLLVVLFVPLTAGIASTMRGPRGCVVVAALAGISLSAALLSIAVTPYFPEHFDNPLGQVVLPSLLEGNAMRNLISDWTGAPTAVVFAAYAAAAVAIVGLALDWLVRPTRWRIRVWAAFLIAIGGHVAILRMSSIPPTQQIEQQRSALLRHLGY
jgi:hypothetical protein